MMIYKGILSAADGQDITPRTGKSTVNVTFSRLPKHLDYIPFTYVDEDCESPGVMLATDDVLIDENSNYVFDDNEGRTFILSEIEEDVDDND